MSDIIPNYNELQPFRFWCQTVLPSVYDDSLSYYELLNKVVAYLNEMGENVSALHTALAEYKAWWDSLDIDVAEEVDKRVSAEIGPTVERQLDKMAEDGTLSALINQDLFVSMNNRINTNTRDISALSLTSVQKNEEDSVGLSMLKQDVREAMTGGSVAVVGTNAVASGNIQNNAVTAPKLAGNARTSYVLYGKIIVDKALKQLTFKTSATFIAVTSNRVFNLKNDLNSTDVIKTWDGILGENIWGYVSFKYTGNIPDFYISASPNETPNYYIGYLFNGLFIPTIDRKTLTIENVGDYLVNNTQGVCDELRGQRIICDFPNNKIVLPRTSNLSLQLGGNYITINTTNSSGSGYQSDVTLSQNFGCLVFNNNDGLLHSVAANAAISENYYILGYWAKSRNFAVFSIPYSIVSYSNSGSNFFNMSPEVQMIGDSIAVGQEATYPRCIQYACDKYYGVRILNYGMSSTGYAYNSSGEHTIGDGTTNKGTPGVLPENNRFIDRVQAMITENTIKDVMLFFGGSNDWSQKMNINEQPAVSGTTLNGHTPGPGESSNIPHADSYKTIVENTFKACLSAGVRVGVILPIRRGVVTETDYVLKTNTVKYYAMNPDTENYPNDVVSTEVHYTLKDYVDVIIEVCNELGIPYLDLYNASLMPNVTAIRNKYFADTAHPNDAGYEQLAIPIAAFVKKWFSNPFKMN